MVAPDEITYEGYGKAGDHNGTVSEDRLLAEGGEDLSDNTHCRKYHNVNCRVRVYPEEMLEEHRVAAKSRVKEPDVENPLGYYHNQCDPNNRSGQHLYPGCCIKRPREEWHPHPFHPRRPHPVDCDNEVQSRSESRRIQG
jgi:hypothetical protein